MNITDAQFKNLLWLSKRGGSGYIDRYGRVVAGGETAPQGAYVAWLKMIADGLVSGGDGRLQITDRGISHLLPLPKVAA